MRLAALVGIMTNNTALKDSAKRYVKEFIRFATFADSTLNQFWRTNGLPGVGWNYVSLTIGGLNTIADAFARIGDTELYTYSTNLGEGTLTPAGGPKTLLSISKRWLDYVDHTVTRYEAGHNGNSSWIIDTVDESEAGSPAWISDTFAAMGNVYWQDARVKSVYLRQASGAPAYPANPSSFGACVYCGDWSTLPGVLFMFGQMEGKVNPYGGTTVMPPPSPAAPSTLQVTVVP